MVKAEIQHHSDNPSAKALVVLAKADHATFKKGIFDTLAGLKSLTSADVPDHHGCRLGKWYDKVSDARVKKLPAFVDLETPHRRVHAAAKQALTHHANGDEHAALEAARELDAASEDVMRMLDRIHQAL